MLIFVFLFSINVYGDTSYSVTTPYDAPPTADEMRAMIYSCTGLSYPDYYFYAHDPKYSNRKLTTYYVFIQSNWCLIPSDNTFSSSACGREICYASIAKLKSDNSVSLSDSTSAFRYYESSGGLLRHLDSYYFYLHTDDNSLCTCSFEANGGWSDYLIPICSSLDNATAWLQHEDAGYLVNGELFIEVPVPEDVAMYEASEEQNIYLYWENSEGFPEGVTSITDNSMQTWIEYGYYYKNVNDEWKFITGDVVEDILPYNRRTQYNISTAPLDGYETGAIIGRIQNKWTLGGIGEALPSPYVEFFYIPYLNEYYVYYYDDEGNYIKMNSYPLNDYGSKNDAFTGGVVPNSDLMVSSPADSDVDYNFFSYLFNGFGLLGNNGIVAAIGSFFTYLPKELMALLIGGVAAVIGVAIFKYFAKA